MKKGKIDKIENAFKKLLLREFLNDLTDDPDDFDIPCELDELLPHNPCDILN